MSPPPHLDPIFAVLAFPASANDCWYRHQFVKGVTKRSTAETAATARALLVMLLFDEVLNISNAPFSCVYGKIKKAVKKGRRGWHETKSQTDSMEGYNLAITGEAHKMQMLPPSFRQRMAAGYVW